MIKITQKQVIVVQDWDDLVEATYGRTYSFQQQDGCKSRENFAIIIPAECDDYKNDTIPDEINGDEMGVSFSAWLKRDPLEWNGEAEDARYIDLFWKRNFYPDVQMIANDLHAKGLIPAGEFIIDIDW